MSKKRPTQSAVFQRYTRAYLGTLIFAAILITVLLMGVAANSIERVENNAHQAVLSQMAADMQLQSEIMTGVRDRIVVSDFYQPTVLRANKYMDIELLDHFSSFVSYSPISNSLFLMYRNEEMIYTTKGTKALLKYHCEASLGIPLENSAQLRSDLLALRSMQILRAQDYGGRPVLLFSLPVVFSRSFQPENAVLVFEVEEAKLRQRMESVSGHAFADYSIYENDVLLAQAGDAASNIENKQPLKAKDHLLSATSADARFTIFARYNNTAFSQAISIYFWQICGIIAAITVVFVIFAVVVATRTSRPIRQLAQRFETPGSQSTYNEFEILENAIQKIESNQKASVRMAKEQFLQVLLHGNGRARMLEQWAQLGVAFDQPHNCVYIVMIPQGANAEELVEEIEGFDEDGLRLYAMHPADRPYVVACCSYCYDHTRSELFDNLCALVDAAQEAVFMGESYDTPLKLPLSYQEARQARHAQNDYSKQLGLAYEQANQRLETIRTAVKCGRVDVVEAELEQLGEILQSSDDSIVLQKYIHHSLTNCLMAFLNENCSANMNRTMDNMLVTDFKLFCTEFLKALGEKRSVPEEINPTVGGDILKFIARNADDCDLCLDMLAEQFALSADYISQLVKAQTGVAFKEYLIRLRMQLAQKLLLEHPDLTINEVASRSGYRAASNFIKRFRDTTGMTPVQFRKKREIS